MRIITIIALLLIAAYLISEILSTNLEWFETYKINTLISISRLKIFGYRLGHLIESVRKKIFYLIGQRLILWYMTIVSDEELVFWEMVTSKESTTRKESEDYYSEYSKDLQKQYDEFSMINKTYSGVCIAKSMCKKCKYFHGVQYDKEALICGLHPKGSLDDNCDDFEWSKDND